MILSLCLLAACAGTIPDIPDSPDAILQKGDDRFARKKYFEAQELYKGFLARHPGHEKSDYAQFMLAESYREDEQYEVAAIEYRLIVNDYGYSEYVDDALYKIGVCNFLRAPRADLDQAPAAEALSTLEQFLRTFPRSPLVPDAERMIQDIKGRLAEKAFKTAMFYYSHDRLTAAMIYFDKIIGDYQGNEFWARALYYKAKVLREQGKAEEAKALFLQVLGYPRDLDVKEEARVHLKELETN